MLYVTKIQGVIKTSQLMHGNTNQTFDLLLPVISLHYVLTSVKICPSPNI